MPTPTSTQEDKQLHPLALLAFLPILLFAFFTMKDHDGSAPCGAHEISPDMTHAQRNACRAAH